MKCLCLLLICALGGMWAQADRATSSNVYKLAPCVKIGGRWYLHLPSA